MKKSKICIGVIACAAIIFSATTFNHVQNNKKENDMPKTASLTVKSEDGLSAIKFDRLTYDSIEGLTTGSALVVEGVVVKKSTNTRDLEKNSKSKTTSQEYEFKVTKWLKGSSNETINIVYPDYTESKVGKFSNGLEPLLEKTEYILFLNPDVADNTYSGAAEPFQFKINSENGNVSIASKFNGVKIKDINNMTKNNLESQISKMKK